MPQREDPLSREVEAAFAPGGALALEPGYVWRAQQAQMALAVAGAIESRSSLVVEAGTGVGKTWAYLVPLLLSGCRAVLSTATKSLQDQLFLRDLPRLLARLAVPVSVALLKGRSSYLCLHRLELARRTARLPDRESVRMLARLEQWAHATQRGDLAELDGLDERSMLIPLVSSTRENCLGSECPQWGECHLVRARREAMAADLVVVNHHLFFADLLLRGTGMAELLPTVDAVIFDEAHQLTQAGLAFLGTSLSSGQIVDLARDLLAAASEQARGLGPWSALSARLEQGSRELRLALGGGGAVGGTQRLAWETVAVQPDLQAGLKSLAAGAREAAEVLEAVAASSPDLARLTQRLRELQAGTQAFLEPAPTDHARWVDVASAAFRLVQSPLDIREALNREREVARRAWIFTSATLGDDEHLSWFTQPAGLEDAQVQRHGSPFDFQGRARLWVSSQFPDPKEAAHPAFVGRLAARCAQALQGRTFVLTTTLRVLPLVAQALREALAGAAPEQGPSWEVLVQGERPRRALMERFEQGHRRVLVASHSFWEGIDVPGDALQCVLIDKLPFPPPHDPLVRAQARKIESQGGDAFERLFVAEAAVSLKQGAGRLLRGEQDRGLLVICDPRLARAGYGRRLRQALPPFGTVNSEAEALQFLRTLQP